MTDINKTERQFGSDENRFQIIADYAPTMIWVSRADKQYDWFNKSWLEFTGRSLSEEIGFGWLEGLHPDDETRCKSVYLKAFDEKKAFSVEYRLRRYDGEYRWVMNNGSPQYSEDGTFRGFIGCCTDINDRKKLEYQLEISKNEKKQLSAEFGYDARLYEVILSNIPDFIYVFDLNHRFTFANDILLKTWGKTFEEAIGKNCLELGYEPWHAEMHDKEIELVKKTKKPIRGEVPFEGVGGRRIYDYIFVPVLGPNGDVEAIAGTTRDVTERYKIEETIRKNQAALKLADQRKDEFLAMLAHELRNPLAPISVAAQMMVHGNFDEGQVRKSSKIIDRQVRHLAALIDDLLDVSRVTRGLVELDLSNQDIHAIITNSLEQIRPLIEAKQQHLIVEICPEPAYILGDFKRLVQILSNVLNNAIKYTSEGGLIRIETSVNNGKVIITIIDNGIGISVEDQLNIFELFAQAKRSSDRSQGGLGVGLSLVKTMVGLHKGYIECFSEGLGLGSQFTITFPLLSETMKEVNSPETPWKLPDNEKPLKILVVDDNSDAAEVLASFLEMSGHKVTVENDPYRALTLAMRELPNVCILDIGLPEMDGNELAKKIKSSPGLSTVKLIAATGYGQQVDFDASKAAGFDYHLVKPIDIEQLSVLLA